MSNANAIQVDERRQQFMDLLGRNKRAIESVVPRHLTPERLLRLALVAANKTPKLLLCTPETVMQCMITSASLGLDVSGALGSAYLVPFYKSRDKVHECTLIVGYRGLCDLARRSGEVADIRARIVHANDAFDYEAGLNEKLYHKPCRDADAGEVIAAYAVAHFRSGPVPHPELMWAHELDAIRTASKSKDDGPWQTHPEEMQKKTASRRLCKWLPMSHELQRALTFEEEGVDVDFELKTGSELLLPTPAQMAQPETEPKASRVAATIRNRKKEQQPQEQKDAREPERQQEAAEEPQEKDVPVRDDPCAVVFSTFFSTAKELIPDDAQLIDTTRDVLGELSFARDSIDFGTKRSTLTLDEARMILSEIRTRLKE